MKVVSPAGRFEALGERRNCTMMKIANKIVEYSREWILRRKALSYNYTTTSIMRASLQR